MLGVRRMVLRERDLEFLRFCFEQKFLQARQVGQWFWVQGGFNNKGSCQRVGRKKLGLYKNHNLIVENTHSLNTTKIYTVTSRGTKVLIDHGQIPEFGLACSFDETTCRHDALVTDVRLNCQHLGLFKNWMADWVLKIHNKDIIPDAIVEHHSPKLKKSVRIAIEVELTQKSKDRLRDIFVAYATSDFQMVLYLMGSEGLLSSYCDQSKHITDKIYFCTVSDFLNLGLKSCWQNHHDSFLTQLFTRGHVNESSQLTAGSVG